MKTYAAEQIDRKLEKLMTTGNGLTKADLAKALLACEAPWYTQTPEGQALLEVIRNG